MSNFDFLQKEWPLVAKLAQTAENYIYDDPNSCLIKLGMLAEHIVSYIVDVNGIVMLEDANTQADKIRQLKAKALLPRDIDDILYGLRKARNEAVHANLDSFERACLMLELAYKLCIWFNATYGTTIVEYSEYILPEKAPNYAEIIEQQEAEIFKLKSIATIAPIKHKSTVQQNRRKSEQNAKLMTLSEKEIRFFIDEQLRKAGWEADTQSIRYSKGTRPIKGRNMAIAEWPTNSSAMKTHDSCFPVEKLAHITGRVHGFVVFNGSNGCFFNLLVREIQVYPVDSFDGVPVVFNLVEFVIFPSRIIHDHNVIFRIVIFRGDLLVELLRRVIGQFFDVPVFIRVPPGKLGRRFSETKGQNTIYIF